VLSRLTAHRLASRSGRLKGGCGQDCPPHMEQPIWNFEQEPFDESPDESSINLRAYFDRMLDEKMRQYSPDWSDEQVIEWDGNFTAEGHLMLPCSERDVEMEEYRQVLAACIRYRDRVRDQYSQSAL
jgi:hypothetical protein